MFKKLLVALLLTLIPSLALGQSGYVHNDVVFDANGHVVPQVTVTVCSGFNISGIPCTPAATTGVFTDSSFTTLLNQTTNPILTDASGNYVIYVAPGNYTVTYSRIGFAGKSLNFSFPCVNNNCTGSGGGSGAFSYTFIPSSSTPTFSAPNNAGFAFTLTSNATATFGTPTQGTIYNFNFCQDNVGGHILTLPGNVVLPFGFSFSTTANTCTQVSFIFDGTNWQPWSTSGGAGAGAANIVQKTNGSGVLQPSSIVDNGTTVVIGEDTQNKGPNPSSDVRAFGVRGLASSTAIPATAGITANITATQNTATVSTTSCPAQTNSVCFVNGDGVIIYGAGSATSLSTPGAPTVLPAEARVGTGTEDVVASPSGTTNYQYQIVARDKVGGLTAASTIGTTSTGLASLGSQSVGISSATCSGSTVTVTTSSPHNLVPGAQIMFTVTAGGNSCLNGFGTYQVATAPDNTHFTYTQGVLTGNGGATSFTGTASVFWMQANHITWTAVPNTWQYYIYGRTSGSMVLLGVTHPSGAYGNDVGFDDFGSTMMGSSTLGIPSYVPTTPPASPTPDPLITTIVSGAGTSNLVLANSASTTVSGATIKFTDGPNIATAAATAGNLYWPASGSFVVNSFTDVSAAQAPHFITASWMYYGGLVLNEPMAFNGNWEGSKPNATSGNASASFTYMGEAVVSTNSNPGLFITNGNGFYDRLAFTGGQNPVFIDTPGNVPSGPQFGEHMYFGTAGSSDYMGIALYMAGVSGGPGFKATRINIGTGPGQQGGGFTGSTFTPSVYINGGGSIIDSIFMQDRGILWRPQSSGGNLLINHGYTQGGITPFVTISGNQTTGGFTSAGVNIGDVTDDTTFQPILTYLPSVGNLAAFVNLGATAGGGTPSITGPTNTSLANPSFFVTGTTSGQNTSAISGSNFTDMPAVVNGVGEFMFPVTNNVAPTAVVSTGGGVPVGGSSYAITVVDANGNESTLSPFVNVTTTTGNQTVTITPPSAPAGAVGYFVYRGATSNPNDRTSETCGSFATFPNTVVDTTAFSCGHGNPSINRAGATSISSVGLVGPALNLIGGGFKSTWSGTFTANRNVTVPDASFIVAGTNVAQTFTANQTFNNTSQLRFLSTNGTNYAGFQGGASTSNLIWLFPTTDSSGTQCLSSNGSLQLAWSNCSAGSGTPGGANTQVQYNGAGSFAGSTNLTWVSPTLSIGTAATSTGQLNLFNGNASGAAVTIQNNVATTAYNFNLPSGPGSNGLPLLSGGGAANPMTFAVLNAAGGGTGSTAFTGGALIQANGPGNQLISAPGTAISTTLGTPLLTLTTQGVTDQALLLNTVASPTGDILDLDINGTKTSWFDSSAFLHTPQTTYSGSGPLSLSGTESTCPAVVSGTDILCLGDSASHSAQISNNGTTFKPIVLWTNTSPTAHGLVVAAPTGAAFPQQNAIAACGVGIPVIGQGATADPICSSLGVVGGGTGGATFTAHGVLLGEGTSAFNASAAGTSGQAFISGGASTDGAYGALNLAGGSSIVTGILPVANGGTGASSFSAASLVQATGTITTGHCMQWASATTATDSGSACGGAGGSPALSSITAGTTTNTINSTTNPQTWNWALTGSTTAFKIGENTAATGSSNTLFDVSTLSASTAKVIQFDNNGNGVSMSSTGILAPLGTGVINANQINGATVPASKTIVGTNSSNQIVDASSATLANNTTGSAGSLSAASALPNGTTCTTQSAGDSTTDCATDAFVATAISTLPFRAGVSDVTAQSSSQSAVTLATSPAAGKYEILYYADQNGTCTTGANSVSFTFNWTDASHARSLSTGSLPLGSAQSSTTGYLSGEFQIFVNSGNVTYTSTVSGSCNTGTSSYDVHVYFEGKP